jgi:serine/threonine protein kinase
MKSGFDTQAPGQPGAGKAGFVPPSVEQIARLFPQLEVLELLGQGGMGAVYKARQPALNRFVALKILPPQSAKDPGFTERFTREARALARLNHPNIVAVHDFGQAVDIPYFIMEYVEGATLRQVVRSGKLSPADTLNIVMQICEALQFAHGEGIVHRDIKPENILLDQRGRVKIADFGIAKVRHQPAQDMALTGAKDVVGTAPYMAPEQLENPASVDHRADIFSLGVVFYELLTGELPLGKFQSPSQKVQIDVRLDDVVLHTLEKEPSRRYQQAREVETDVATIAATPAESAPPPLETQPPIPAASTPRAGMSTGWKAVLLVGALAIAALVLIVGLAGLFLVGLWPHAQQEAAMMTGLANSNAFWTLLNEDQRLVVQWTDRKFKDYNDGRTFEGWSNEERADLERRSIDTLKGPRTTPKGPRSNEYYQAINTLAAMRSTAALPALRSLAFDHVDKILRSEISNRRRWMATRAFGVMGDKTVVPQLIHLLYHNHAYVRWWAQISLVRLTGQNFGSDWKAWGHWWSAHHGQPPFNPQVVHWWKGQAEPAQLAQSLAEADRSFIQGLKTHSPVEASLAEAEENDDIRELGAAALQGDPAALERMAKLAAAALTMNSAEQARVRSDFRLAFAALGTEAGKGNAAGLQTLLEASQVPALEGYAVEGLGQAAGQGNKEALKPLLDPENSHILRSLAVMALKPAADAGEVRAIAALAETAADRRHQPLWFLAANGLATAASAGNITAIDSLAALAADENQSVRSESVRALEAAAAKGQLRAEAALAKLGLK